MDAIGLSPGFAGWGGGKRMVLRGGAGAGAWKRMHVLDGGAPLFLVCVWFCFLDSSQVTVNVSSESGRRNEASLGEAEGGAS